MGKKALVRLDQMGKVLGFNDFINEVLDVEVNPNHIEIHPVQDEVIQKVENIIEQVSGWDLDVLMDYIADLYSVEEATKNDLIIWITTQVKKYSQATINIKGECNIPKDKRGKFAWGVLAIDEQMMVEKILRKLLKIDDDDSEDVPAYIDSILNLVNDCIPEPAEDWEDEEE